MSQDAVDFIKAQWQKEKPDLPTNAMETLGRLKRCSVLYQPMLDRVFSQFDLSSWEFDMLATLRRSGQPYTLTPTQLFSSLMVTSGTMTHRLKTLETKGWIERVATQQDARQKAVKLSSAGFDLIERALPAHSQNLENILSNLPENEQDALNNALRSLLDILETRHTKDPSLPSGLSDKTHGV